MVVGYMYYDLSSEITHRPYFGPGRQYKFREHSTVRLGAVKEGELVQIHMGHGHFDEFEVVAEDGVTAILVLRGRAPASNICSGEADHV